jgi:hypothetical protein
VRFASFLSDGFITAIVVNPLEKNLSKRTSVHCAGLLIEGRGALMLYASNNDLPAAQSTIGIRTVSSIVFFTELV